MKLSRKLLLGSVAVVALAAGIAIGQVTLPQVTAINTTDLFQIIPGGVPTAQSQFASLARMRSATLAGVGSHTGSPTLGIGTTSGGSIVGTDMGFLLTQGSAANTSLAVTFGQAFNAIPVCTVVNPLNTTLTTTLTYSVSTSGITLTQASLSSQVYNVHCIGRTGG